MPSQRHCGALRDLVRRPRHLQGSSKQLVGSLASRPRHLQGALGALTYLPTYSLTYLLAYSLAYLLACSLAYSLLRRSRRSRR